MRRRTWRTCTRTAVRGDDSAGEPASALDCRSEITVEIRVHYPPGFLGETIFQATNVWRAMRRDLVRAYNRGVR